MASLLYASERSFKLMVVYNRRSARGPWPRR
jgi:hypothetical protein